MLRWWVVLGLLGPGIAWGSPTRDRIMALLNAYEDTVIEADLRALGSGVETELIAIAGDASEPITRRARAVGALKYYPTSAVSSFLAGQLGASVDPLLRRKAVYALTGFGPSAVGQIAPLLSDSDVQMRIAAAGALGMVGDEASRRALSDRLAIEPDGAVQNALRQAGGR